MNRYILFLAGAVIAVGGLFGGCGSDSSSTVAAETPTKAEFIKKADAVCKKTDQRQQAGLLLFLQKHEGQSGLKVEAELVDQVGVPAVEQEAKELAQLTPPDGEAAQVEEIIKAIKEATAVVKEHPRGMLQPEGPGAFANAQKLARAYGLQSCGEP